MRRGTDKASNTSEVSQQKQDFRLREVSFLDTIMPLLTELYWLEKKVNMQPKQMFFRVLNSGLITPLGLIA